MNLMRCKVIFIILTANFVDNATGLLLNPPIPKSVRADLQAPRPIIHPFRGPRIAEVAGGKSPATSNLFVTFSCSTAKRSLCDTGCSARHKDLRGNCDEGACICIRIGDGYRPPAGNVGVKFQTDCADEEKKSQCVGHCLSLRRGLRPVCRDKMCYCAYDRSPRRRLRRGSPRPSNSPRRPPGSPDSLIKSHLNSDNMSPRRLRYPRRLPLRLPYRPRPRLKIGDDNPEGLDELKNFLKSPTVERTSSEENDPTSRRRTYAPGEKKYINERTNPTNERKPSAYETKAPLHRKKTPTSARKNSSSSGRKVPSYERGAPSSSGKKVPSSRGRKDSTSPGRKNNIKSGERSSKSNPGTPRKTSKTPEKSRNNPGSPKKTSPSEKRSSSRGRQDKLNERDDEEEDPEDENYKRKDPHNRLSNDRNDVYSSPKKGSRNRRDDEEEEYRSPKKGTRRNDDDEEEEDDGDGDGYNNPYNPNTKQQKPLNNYEDRAPSRKGLNRSPAGYQKPTESRSPAGGRSPKRNGTPKVSPTPKKSQTPKGTGSPKRTATPKATGSPKGGRTPGRGNTPKSSNQLDPDGDISRDQPYPQNIVPPPAKGEFPADPVRSNGTPRRPGTSPASGRSRPNSPVKPSSLYNDKPLDPYNRDRDRGSDRDRDRDRGRGRGRDLDPYDDEEEEEEEEYDPRYDDPRLANSRYSDPRFDDRRYDEDMEDPRDRRYDRDEYEPRDDYRPRDDYKPRDDRVSNYEPQTTQYGRTNSPSRSAARY